jgi:toxin ParE1/3/4
MAGASVSSKVLLTAGAEQDLESIHDYLFRSHGAAAAEAVLDRLVKTMESLSRFPERGHYPRELLALGIKEYRQTLFKPYRLIYRVVGKSVIVHLIADSRRDMQSLLARRLLAA